MTKEIQKPETKTEVWSDFDRAFNELRSRMYDTFGFAPFGAPLFARLDREFEGFRPARADITDTGTSYKIVAEIPGIPKENLDIRVRGTNVEIRGEMAKETTGKGADYVHQERSYAGFYRTLELPEEVVASDAKAKVEHGLLELELPKRTPTPPETEVKVRVS
jgi:HSP20 family molecular chaperone IbpA